MTSTRRFGSYALACLATVPLLGVVPPAAVAQAPPATLTQTPPPAVPAQPAPPASAAPRPTLIPGAGDSSDVDEVALPEKPVLILSGSAKWEDGLKTLRAAFARLDEELRKAGLSAAGRPVSVFTQTSDDGFRFDAMMPIASAPTTPTTLPPEMRLGVTPSGKAYRFVHKGPYDDIDSTYETITAYLDAKDIVAKDAFVEEYLNDVADPADPNLEINIFVQPK